MNSQVCVICCNQKTVNQTTNRLVTESCGHVKCMNCLLTEKSGCQACLRSESILKERDNEIKTIEVPVINSEEFSKKDDVYLDTLNCKKKTEYSHIKVEIACIRNETESFKERENEIKTIEVPVIDSEDFSKQDVYLESLNFKKKTEYSHIIVEIENGRKCFRCTICGKKFHARSQVSYHSYCNGQKKPYSCQPCKQSFISLSHFKYHMRIHNQEKPYTCEVCSASFCQTSKLKRHRLKHTKEKSHRCNECNKGFNNLTSLRKHMLLHTDERPYTCPVCNKRFRDVSNYKKHVDKHKKICTVCHVKLPEDGQHKCPTKGDGPRAHACPRCRKAFHSRKDMRRHAAIHSDSKPFRCKVCPEERRFRRKDNLERHIRNAHPDCNPAAALECDIDALQIITNNALSDPDKGYEQTEKIRLEILNPLPPLPQEVIQKHIDVNTPKEVTNVVDKKSIIEANNARQSVIVEKKTEKVPSPENEYVHKIRKAIIPLPPIDQEKFKSVQRGIIPDSGNAPIKNMEIYKKILYGRLEKDTTQIQNPKTHWIRKMEQNIN